MAKSVDFSSVLALIDRGIKPHYLSPTQEIVLREVWNGQTYSKMAQVYNYDPDYIKTVGCNLWKTLSAAFDEPINKTNFVPFMRHKISTFILAENFDNSDSLVEKNSPTDFDKQVSKPHCQWSTAPNVQHFIGREKEVDILKSWSNNPSCNCIVVSGMIGCGKTSLITKFAKEIKHQFDHVIWLSLENTLPINKLIENYLITINENSQTSLNIKSEKLQDLNSLLSEFISALKKKKVLLLLDNFESILEIDDKSFHYKENLENYGHFLRSIISTNHQSLLICASRVKPKLFEYYGTNQVKLLDLQGLQRANVSRLIAAKDHSDFNEEKLLGLAESLQNNPQLIQITDEHLDLFDEKKHDIEQIIQELSQLEAIISLLNHELNCLTKLEQEIMFWLAISSTPVSRKYLVNQSPHLNFNIKLANSIKSLTMRSLITEHDSKYFLMPIMKSYLRRKLVMEAL